MSHLTTADIIWISIGFGGQFLFAGRFLIQWLYSEKHRRSVIPVAFWYFSIFGSLTLLVYSIHKLEPVFIAGQAFGVLIYSRNLYFIYKERREA
jgi:lipid-A-disaccharide synthase-like uncharacterized protein